MKDNIFPYLSKNLYSKENALYFSFQKTAEGSNHWFISIVLSSLLVATFRSGDEDDYEYEFSVLSMGIRFGGRHFSKCACSEQKTRTRPRPPI